MASEVCVFAVISNFWMLFSQFQWHYHRFQYENTGDLVYWDNFPWQTEAAKQRWPCSLQLHWQKAVEKQKYKTGRQSQCSLGWNELTGNKVSLVSSNWIQQSQ